jgi:DNA-binding MarR family transcriptional regulator
MIRAMGGCRIPRPKDPAAAARAEVVELLFSYVERLRAHFEGVALEHDLTPVQAKVVLFLDVEEPMRCLAESLACDPSNITGIVDRLEERGYVTRVASPTDRRVTLLQPTAAGKKLRESFVGSLFRDVPGMKDLSHAQIRDLRDVMATLCAAEATVQAKA